MLNRTEAAPVRQIEPRDTYVRTSGNSTEIKITSDHDHRIVSVVTMTTAETKTATTTTTEGDQTTAATATTMTNTISTTTIGMTATIRGIHVMIDGTLIEDRTTIKGITTIDVGTLLKTNRAALTHSGPTRLHQRWGTTHTLPHTQIMVTPVTRHRLPALSVTNPATTLPNAQPRTTGRPRP